MSIVSFLVAIFLLQRLRKTLVTTPYASDLQKILRIAMISAILLILVEVTFSVDYITKWIWYVFLLLIIGSIFAKEEFAGSRNLTYAVLPFLIVSLLGDTVKILNQRRYDAWETLFDVAGFFSIIWLIAMWINSNKQQKALEKEREKRRAEEELNKEIAKRKIELESIVTERTTELIQQKEELEKLVAELKSTQTQLIQKEKLASLGELTAGIAHEIQNPLNFVNNFSELGSDLLVEIKDKLEMGNKEEALMLTQDLEQNLQKINYHGKRADAIVKGMLQHSRSSTGEKKPVDINALVDQYLRLAYHGMRAKDHSFNAIIKSNFSPEMGLVDIVPEDIGRVLLNLFDNAFYSMRQKQKLNIPDYKPELTVSTSRNRSCMEIIVGDNGRGFNDNIKNKLFQPFFTTKPAGEGTGLGLSMSYDIVVKGHGGELKAETNVGEFAKFTISIPLNGKELKVEG